MYHKQTNQPLLIAVTTGKLAMLPLHTKVHVTYVCKSYQASYCTSKDCVSYGRQAARSSLSMTHNYATAVFLFVRPSNLLVRKGALFSQTAVHPVTRITIRIA